MLGPKNAGKTTMLAQSNLHFILEKKFKNKQITNSKDYTFWVTKKAIIIDSPGIYFQHKPALWNLFLRLTKKYCRSHKPQGIIVVLDIQDLLIPAKRNAIYKNLREKITSIQKNFRTDIPWFFIVNKLKFYHNTYSP